MLKKLCFVTILFCLSLLGFVVQTLPVQAEGETPTPTPTPISCAVADNYFNAGLLNKAKEAYTTVLGEKPGEKCAVDGLKLIGAKMCTLAQTQVASNDLEGAKATYKEILTDLPDLDCAKNGLLALSPASCTEADSYLQDGAVKLAEDTYNNILETQPRETCALNGLRQVAVKKCALGDLQAKSGQIDTAKTTYEEILTSYPNLECAVNGQAALSTTPAKIRGLVQLGDYDTAWTDLQAAIKTNPEDKELQNLAKEPWAYWYGIKVSFTSFIGKLITAVVIVLIGVIFFVFSRKLKLDIEKIDASVFGDTQKTALENEIQARFEQALGSQGQLRRFKNPDLIDGPLDELSLPVLGLPEPFNKYLEFIVKLIMPNVVTINGSLTIDKKKGAGIIIRLTQSGNKQLWGVDSVWESDVIPDFNPDTQPKEIEGDRYKALVKYAAVLAHWIYYQHRKPRGLRRAFGTESYRSHILTRVATELQEKEPSKDKKLVGMMFRQALVEDPDNYVAMLNLGKFTLRVNPNESDKLLKRVESLTQTHEGLMTLPHIYATYRLGANKLENYTLDPKKNAGDLDEALEKLRAAVNDAQKIQKKNPEITKEVVDMIRIPYADALRRKGAKYTDPAQIIKDIEDGTFAAPRVLYNLACYYSCGITLPNVTPNSKSKDLDMALDYLERTLLANPVHFIDAETDPSLVFLRDGEKKQEYIKRIRGKFGKKESATPQKTGKNQ